MPNVALLPITGSPDDIVSYLEENFRRIANAFSMPVPAASVTPGALPAGKLIIDGGLIVLQDTSAGGLELYHDNSTPYIDFHRAADSAGDSNADYNIRIINDAANRLNIRTVSASNSITGGLLYVGNAYMGSHPVHGASWAGFGHINRVASSEYQILCHDNGEILFNTSGSVKRFRFYEDGATQWAGLDSSGWIVGNAKMGTHPVHTGYAWMGHKDMFGSSQYGFIQSAAETIINGPTSYMSQNGAWRLRVDTAVTTNVRLNVTGGILILNDWFRVTGNNGIHWENHGGGWFMQDTTWMRTYGSRGVFSATGYIRSDSRLVAGSSHGSVGVCLKHQDDLTHRVYHWGGQDGCSLDSWAFSAIRSIQYDLMVEAGRGSAARHVNNASSAWRDSGAATHWNNSDPKSKKGMRRLADDSPQLAKVKAVKPIRFKWNEKQRPPDEPEREFFGFDATELPAEVVRSMPLMTGTEDVQTSEESLMVNPTALVAMLWEAFLEMHDEVTDKHSKMESSMRELRAETEKIKGKSQS